MEQSPLYSPILPLNFSCFPTVAEMSLRTAMGRRCRLLCYVDLGNGHHFSQSFLYNLHFEILAPRFSLDLNSPIPISIPSVVLAPPPDPTIHRSLQLSNWKIMCQHHRMRCRHGGSWGGATHLSSLPPSVSTSSSTYPFPSPSTSRFLCRYSKTSSC